MRVRPGNISVAPSGRCIDANRWRGHIARGSVVGRSLVWSCMSVVCWEWDLLYLTHVGAGFVVPTLVNLETLPLYQTTKTREVGLLLYRTTQPPKPCMGAAT